MVLQAALPSKKKPHTQPQQQAQEASSVLECKSNPACKTLNLSGTLPEPLLPVELASLSQLTCLNVSCNPLREVPKGVRFPPNLRELHVSGCELSSLPDCLALLGKLERLFAGANRLTNADIVFKLPSLQHAGLGYNAIAELPRHLLPTCSSLLSLDISHNSLEDMEQAFADLDSLPSLQVLTINGNPMCLLPCYATRSQEHFLPKLVYMDGQRLDAMTSRPPAGGAAHYASSSSIRSDSQLSPRPSGQPGGPLEAFKGSPAAAPAQAPAQMLAPEEAARLTAQGHTHLRLDLRGLAPTDDPFAPLHAMWAEELSAAQAAGVPPVLTLLPPPQPYTYHVELEGWETEADAVGEGGEAEQAGAQEVQDEGAAGQQQEGAGQEGAGQGEGAGPEEGQPQPQEAAAAAAADAAAAGEGSPQRSAPDAGPPPPKPTFEADVPLVPFRTRYASTPVVLQPPEAPVVEPDAPAAGSKAAKAAAAKAAAKAPAKPSPKGARASSRGADGGAEAGPVKLDRGCLQAVVPLPARVRARNWLRNGIQLKLYVTRLEAVLKPEPVQPPEPPEPAPVATKGGKGKRPTSSDKNKDRPRSGKKEKEPVPEPPVVDLTKYDFVPHTTLLGLATLRAGALLVKGSAEQASEAVVFTPVPALWDERGMRMALEDPRHSKRAVAHMEATLALHVPLPDLRAIPILQNFPGMAPPPPAGKGK